MMKDGIKMMRMGKVAWQWVQPGLFSLFFPLIFALFIFSDKADATAKQAGDQVLFEISLPKAEKVALSGSFNGWNTTTHQLEKGTDGKFRISVILAPGRYRFKYFVDDGQWFLDPEAPNEEKDGIVDSVITVIPSTETVAPAPGTRFKIRSDTAKTISVVGSFNHWNLDANPLSDPDGDQIWETTVYIPPGEYIYMFVIDGIEWRPDPEPKHTRPDGYGGTNSLVIVE